MQKLIGCCLVVLLCIKLSAQTVEQKLAAAFGRFENDPQLQFAISSLYVIDATTGKVVFDKNSRVGLAPASTQKIITSITAFELLGKAYQYKTSFGLDKSGTLHIEGSGDPTLGSDRYAATKATAVKERLLKRLPAGARVATVSVDQKDRRWQDIPDGWIWQDLANYYGAATEKLNWRENKFDLVLESGNKIGDPVNIVRTDPGVLDTYAIQSLATAAARGTGDNAYIYFPVDGTTAIVKGTIPVSEKRFVIAGALPSGAVQMAKEVADTLSKALQTDVIIADIPGSGEPTVFHTELSPPLDSIIYWFNRRSINLYGEAMLHAMAYEKAGRASADSGIAVLKRFWKQQGINVLELNMMDGSGLSPLNRLTTHVQVEVLKHARSQPWFSSFQASLPDYNGMKMKSGTIQGVKGFSGYHTAASGRQYIFSFVVNNYNGSARTLVNKMYKVLDLLK